MEALCAVAGWVFLQYIAERFSIVAAMGLLLALCFIA